MTRLLYDIAIQLLGIILFMGGLFHEKTRKRWKLQKNWKNHLPKEPVDLWVHCASLGEFDQGLPIMWAYRNEFPEAKIMVSFFSPSGYEHYHKRNHCVDYACILPLDTRNNAVYFLEKTQPKMALFVKYEYWLNFIFAIHKKNIPIYAAAALFQQNHPAFKPWGGIFRRGLRKFSFFFVQNEDSKTLLKGIGIHQVSVVGDPRFDNVVGQKRHHEQQENSDENLSELHKICENQRVLIVGSSWKKEEEILYEVLDPLPFDTIILAPHNVSDAHLSEIETLFGQNCRRLSHIKDYQQEPIILVDSIGLLHQLYRLGSMALVGGGFTGRLHNILEPAAYGLPVVFGPKIGHVPEAKLFIEQGIAKTFSNKEELLSAIQGLLVSLEKRRTRATNLMLEQCGATQKIMHALKSRHAYRAAPSN